MALKKILIDDLEIEVSDTLTLIQACEQAGVEIPRFCYHERLSIAGNCRMCLVEVKGAPKPQASCALAVSDLRAGPNGELPQVITKSATVTKARKGVMEFLLANHPLDCPVCDQGGECDLQDQAMVYGSDKSRFVFPKRAVEEKEFGPVIKTEMTRCIHCTRCVRFSTEVAGVPEMGAINRGEDTEITTYLEKIVTNELSGNVIDLCPVGALTSKPVAFTARPWEMKKIETIDVTDGLCSAITMQVRGNEVMRIAPRNDDDVNEEWISNKARFAHDGLKRQRIDKAYVRKNGKLEVVALDIALDIVLEKLKTTKSAFYAGGHSSLETLYATKKFAEIFNAVTESRPKNTALPNALSLVKFNPQIQNIEHSTAILLIGTDPRKEAAVLNARIRKAWLCNKAEIALIGENFNANYDMVHLGLGADALNKFVSSEFAQKLKSAHNPMIIVGEGAVNGPDGMNVIATVHNILETLGLSQNCYGFLSQTAGLVGAVALGFVGNGSVDDFYSGCVTHNIQTVISLGNDDLQYHRLEKQFKIYIGSHGDIGANHADVILPTTAYSEADGLYLNLEGRVREATRAVFPLGDSKETWAIWRYLSEKNGSTLPFDSFSELRENMFTEFPEFRNIDDVVALNAEVKRIPMNGHCTQAVYRTTIKEYYYTDAITRASKVLRDCQKAVDEKDADMISQNQAA